MRFATMGGHAVLDFINTVGGRVYETKQRYAVDRDRLGSSVDFFEFAAEAGLCGAGLRPAVAPASSRLSSAARRAASRPAGGRPHASAAFLQRVIRLREALYRIFKSVAEDRRPDAADVELFNRELAGARAHEKLAFTGAKAAFAFDAGDTPDAPLWAIARAAAELLTSDEQRSRIKACGGESCGWLFLDTTRNRSRQWCDMRDCGNLAKVRRFRERQRESP